MPLEFDHNSLRLIGCGEELIKFYDNSSPPVHVASIFLNDACDLVIGEPGAGGSEATPLTLTATTLNQVTAQGHTHDVLASSNPGVSKSLLETDNNGDLILQDLTLRGGDLRNDVGKLTITPTVTLASAASAILDAIKFNAGTVTVTGATTITTSPLAAYTFAQPTIDFTGGATAGEVATVHIVNAPADPDASIDQLYALWISAGETYIGDKIRLGDNPGSLSSHTIHHIKIYTNENTNAIQLNPTYNFTSSASRSPVGLTVNLVENPGANNNTGTAKGIRVQASRATTVAGSGTTTSLYALEAIALHNSGGASTGSTVTNLFGADVVSRNANNATTTTVYGLRSTADQSAGASGGDITTAYALYADVTRSSGSKAITTSYGLYVDTLFGTTTYGVYITGPETLALWVDSGKTRLDTAVTIASAAGAVLDGVSIPADTITITGSTNITTATGFNLVNIGQSTYSAASALTITNAATLYIANSPLGGGAGPVTITNAYAFWVDAGNVRLDTAVALGGGAAPTFGTIGGSGPATAAQNEWIRIDTQNGVRFVPAWA